jgi:hypothetical protein
LTARFLSGMIFADLDLNGAAMENETPAANAGTVTAGTSDATPTAQLGAIAAELVGEKPAVSEHAIAAHVARTAANADKDSTGAAFNPAIHAVNADGSPRKTTRGAFAMKRGRKAGTVEAPKATPKGIVIPGTAPGANAKEQEARAGGVGATNLVLMTLVALGGQEWQPVKDDKIGRDEKLMLETATGDFFVAQGWQDLPPGWALVAAWGMYALPRFTMPQTKSRAQKVKEWVFGKIGSWRAKRAARKRGVPESDIEREDRLLREARKGDADRA